MGFHEASDTIKMFYTRVWVGKIGGRETDTLVRKRKQSSQNVLTSNHVLLWILTETWRKVVGKWHWNDWNRRWNWLNHLWTNHKEPFPSWKRCVGYCLWFSEMTALAIESLFSLEDQAAGLGKGGVDCGRTWLGLIFWVYWINLISWHICEIDGVS